MQYLVSFLVLQSSRWGRESWLLYLGCCLAVVWLLVLYVFSSRCRECCECISSCSWADPDGGQGVPPPPLKNHKFKGFLSKIGPDSLQKSKSYQASIQCWAIIDPPAKRRLNGVSLVGLWVLTFSGIWSSLPHYLKKKLSVLDPLWQTSWIRAYCSYTHYLS